VQKAKIRNCSPSGNLPKNTEYSIKQSEIHLISHQATRGKLNTASTRNSPTLSAFLLKKSPNPTIVHVLYFGDQAKGECYGTKQLEQTPDPPIWGHGDVELLEVLIIGELGEQLEAELELDELEDDEWPYHGSLELPWLADARSSAGSPTWNALSILLKTRYL
jgi:hypothetical protein